MSIAVDCVTAPSNAALKLAGVSAVCRYLSWQGSRDSLGKVIGAAEYQRLVSGGIAVLLNWEYDARDWLGGTSAGATHGAEAVRQARALGCPAGRAIVGSADFDMTSAQWTSAGHAYATSFASTVRAAGYVAGVYGPYDVLTWCQATGLYGVYWQAGMSTSWSGGRNRNVWSGVHLRQVRQQTIGGLDCDANEIHQADFGQYPGGTAMQWTNASTANLVGGRDPDTLLIDLWSGEQREDSALAPGQATARQRHLAGIEHSLADLKAAVAALGTPTLTDAQMASLTAAVSAAVVASHDALTDADKPVIQAAVEAGVRDVLHAA